MFGKRHIFILALVLGLSSAFVSADGGGEKTEAEIIQELLLNGGSASGTVSATDGSSDLVQNADDGSSLEHLLADPVSKAETLYSIPVSELGARIRALDQENPDPIEVRSLRAAYDEMTMADQLQIVDIGLLEAAEKTLLNSDASSEETTTSVYSEAESTEPTPKEPNIPSKNYLKGRSFDFIIRDVGERLSITAKFATDDNNDDRMDVADFELIGPDGSSTTITTRTKEIVRGDMDIICNWEEGFLQLDISKIPVGGWNIQASVPVIFSRTEYRGATVPVPDTPVETTPAAANIKPDAALASSSLGPLLMLGVVPLLIVGGLVGFMFFTKRIFNTGEGVGGLKKPSSSGGKKKSLLPVNLPVLNNKQGEEKESEAIHQETDTELLERIRSEIREQQMINEQMNEDAERERQQEAEERGAFGEDRMAVTQREYDEDIPEPFVDHVGDTDVLAKKDGSKEPQKKRFGGRFG